MRITGVRNVKFTKNGPEESKRCNKGDYLGGENIEPLDCIPGKFTKRYSTTRNIQVKLFNFKDKEFFKH